jgi:hypothetical protein
MNGQNVVATLLSPKRPAMNLPRLTRTLSISTLLFLPFAPACSGQDHPVGNNSQKSELVTNPCGKGSVICNEPDIPPGCHVGAGSCVDGKYQCPPVVCPADAGSCSGKGVVCSEPNIPVGCHLGASSCVDGHYQCPPVECPVDAGGCSGEGVICSEPDIPPGCHLGAASCIDGKYECPPVVCP